MMRRFKLSIASDGEPIDVRNHTRRAAAHLLEHLHDLAWYGHPKELNNRKWYIEAVISRGIAFIEYMLQVPANRIGYTQMTLPRLKIMREVITLGVFVPFAFFFMQTPLKLDYLCAALCMVGAVFFIFRL